MTDRPAITKKERKQLELYRTIKSDKAPPRLCPGTDKRPNGWIAYDMCEAALREAEARIVELEKMLKKEKIK